MASGDDLFSQAAEPRVAAAGATTFRVPGQLSLHPGPAGGQAAVATETMGWAGGLAPREPAKGLSEKAKMPPSVATMR